MPQVFVYRHPVMQLRAKYVSPTGKLVGALPHGSVIMFRSASLLVLRVWNVNLMVPASHHLAQLERRGSMVYVNRRVRPVSRGMRS